VGKTRLIDNIILNGSPDWATFGNG
jgi:hypothetical protein